LAPIRGELYAAVPQFRGSGRCVGAGGDELGHMLVALDPAERALGVEHPGGCPARHHVAVAPQRVTLRFVVRAMLIMDSTGFDVLPPPAYPRSVQHRRTCRSSPRNQAGRLRVGPVEARSQRTRVPPRVQVGPPRRSTELSGRPHRGGRSQLRTTGHLPCTRATVGMPSDCSRVLHVGAMLTELRIELPWSLAWLLLVVRRLRFGWYFPSRLTMQ